MKYIERRAELANGGEPSASQALSLAERHAQFSNIMAASTIGSSTSASIASISAKTTNTSISASASTGIGTSTNTSTTNNSTAFGLSSSGLSERERRGKAESVRIKLKQIKQMSLRRCSRPLRGLGRHLCS